jgi:hypothetical protein
MKRVLNKLKKLARNVTRRAKKGFRNVTRAAKKFMHRGGNPNATAPVVAPRKRYRKRAKGPLRRVTNAVRRVGKKFRNTLSQVFSRKTKRRRSRRRVQKGSSENIPVNAVQSQDSGPSKNGIPATSPGIPPAPPL